ncbi:hypothetical protein BRADI_1g54931v3 [Brachypodium distachyon]|uniref:Uncharacterized protein n=1 Tax=Brachypodium distachyon TaxID=15368 RepID=A0A2K2DRF9_BRADI|nr:hypothetical protein BRADI_1g54931v3 [Brachypodium distachyon]
MLLPLWQYVVLSAIESHRTRLSEYETVGLVCPNRLPRYIISYGSIYRSTDPSFPNPTLTRTVDRQASRRRDEERYSRSPDFLLRNKKKDLQRPDFQSGFDRSSSSLSVSRCC